MPKRHIITITLMMLSAFSGGAFMTWVLQDQPAYAQSRDFSPATWEYQRATHSVFANNDIQFQKELSKYTSDGWELIQVNEGPQYSNQIITYWKRINTSVAY
ncbi:MAG: hypothetical protein ACO36I_07005 [Candidatus Latescibacterota bacterium]